MACQRRTAPVLSERRVWVGPSSPISSVWESLAIWVEHVFILQGFGLPFSNRFSAAYDAWASLLRWWILALRWWMIMIKVLWEGSPSLTVSWWDAGCLRLHWVIGEEKKNEHNQLTLRKALSHNTCCFLEARRAQSSRLTVRYLILARSVPCRPRN